MTPRTAVLALLIGALASCAPAPDTWNRRAPRAITQRLPDDRVLRVVAAHQQAAQARLAIVSVAPVTARETAAMCECTPVVAPSGWWLVRSVSMFPTSDRIDVRESGGTVEVHRDALGSAGLDHREALLVAPTAPLRGACATSGSAE